MKPWEEDETFLGRWLNGDVSEAEKAEFEGSEEGKSYQALVMAADTLRAPEYDTEAELRKLQERLQEAPEAKVVPMYRRPVVQLLVAASVALLVLITVLRPRDTTITTAYGQQEVVTLPDGSQVRMHANSTLAYNPKSWEAERHLTLEGEAFFEVEKGSSFVVETEAGKVTVLGTSFNVRQRADALEVVCYTGKVGVSVEATEEVLTPGWEVRFEKGELVRRQNVDLSEAPTWLEGATPLEDVPLGEALQELVHVYGISLDYNEDLDSLRIRTIVPHDNLENALQLIMGAVDLPYDYDEKTRNLVVKGTGI